ncbi:MAG: hypothetical protein H0W89_05125 [Candidatus Levybacteria bacterium]|nr:hypothetical protein [Candidatus Levybacteria bacterium]
MAVEINHPDPIDKSIATGITRPGGGSLDTSGPGGLPTAPKGDIGFISPHLDAIEAADAQYDADSADLGPLGKMAYSAHTSSMLGQAYSIDANGNAHPQAFGAENAANVDKWTARMDKVDRGIEALGTVAKTLFTSGKSSQRE